MTPSATDFISARRSIFPSWQNLAFVSCDDKAVVYGKLVRDPMISRVKFRMRGEPAERPRNIVRPAQSAGTLPPELARRCRHGRSRRLAFPVSVAEHLTCLTAPDIFDHLVKSGCANIGGHPCRPMRDFNNGVQR
jgi:hypothetical protein